MKSTYLIIALLFALGACSSAEKTQEKAESQVEKAEKAVDEAQEKVKQKAEGSSSDMRTECTLDNDTRVIEVRKTDEGGCELFYTKFGEEKSVASSGFGTQYCEEVRDRIQSNLSKAGFSCE